MDKRLEIFIEQSGQDINIDVALDEHEDIDVQFEGVVLMNPDDIDPEIKNYLENPNDLTTLYIGDQQINVSSYRHIQTVASATWNVVHNLDREGVMIQVFDSNNINVLAEIENIDENNAVIRFAFPVAGTAECR